VAQISESVFAINEVIARVDTAILFNCHATSAHFGHCANLRGLVHPLTNYRLEQIDEHVAEVIVPPRLKRAEERFAVWTTWKTFCGASMPTNSKPRTAKPSGRWSNPTFI